MRLEVTRKSDLAVRALLALRAAGARVKGPELAEAVGTTPGFVSQTLAPLVRRGWVTSEPGPTGGYALGVDLEEISVLAVIETIEGPTDTGRCVLADRACGEEGTCALHVPWQTARTELLGRLDATSVAAASPVPGAGS